MEKGIEVLISLLDLILKSERVYDLFTCSFVKVYKLCFGEQFTYITKEKYEILKDLGIKSYDYED